VLTLETAIAETQATSQASALDRNADNEWSRADFAREAPGLDWAAFFEAAGLAQQQAVVAWQPSAVKGLAALVASRPLETWKDYLRFPRSMEAPTSYRAHSPRPRLRCAGIGARRACVGGHAVSDG
jgi:predicted metalloendopeptidase